MHGLAADFRFALRMLLRRPVVAFIAIFTLALGMGAGTAMFSVVDAVLLRPLPYRDADRLVFVWSTFASSDGMEGNSALPDFRVWRDDSRTLESLGGYSYREASLWSSMGEPERRQAAAVTKELFPVLGIAPRLGRGFSAEDEQWGRHRVVLISDRLWQDRFGADPAILGREITLSGRPYTVVGVMPPGMRFFEDVPKVDLFVPISHEAGDIMDSRDNHYVTLVGRLRPGSEVAAAQEDLAAIARRIAEEDPRNAGVGVRVRSAHEQLTRDVRPALVILLGAVALLLLVACVNVANLLLARAVDRQREMAVRASLGATPGRLFRQVLVEAFILAILGGAAGLVFAWWGLEAVVALLPESIPRHNEVAIDGRVLGFTAAASIVTVLLFGTLPALQVARAGVQEQLKEAGVQVTDSRRRRRLRAALVAGEMALALMLLVGAALLGRSFLRLQSADAGFAADEIVALRVPLASPRYMEAEVGAAFFAELSERLRALPGVTAVGMGTRLPLGFGSGWGKHFWVEDWPPPPSVEKVPGVSFALVDHDYFRALGVPVRRGRAFRITDDAKAPQVAIVNEALARRHFDGADPVGRFIRMCAPASVRPDNQCPRRQIVGVVADLSTESLGRPADAYAYVPYRQYENEGWVGELTVVLRAAGSPVALVPAAREQVRALDSRLAIANVMTGAELRARSVAMNRFSLLLLGVFAVLAATLAAIGIYGVVSYLTARRTHEMGLRMALGARPRDVQSLVIAQGMRMTVAGILVGAGGALALGRLLRSLLYGVAPTDVMAYVIVIVPLAGVALLACWLPARRAAKVDPMTSLRSTN